MTVMDRLIGRHGSSVDLQYLTEGAEDSYGFPAQTWSWRATEMVWLQRASLVASGRGATGIVLTIAGRLDESDFIGFVKSGSVVQRDDWFEVGGVKYDVLLVEPQMLFNKVHHVEAHVRRRDEG
jgi:hypothetical protein